MTSTLVKGRVKVPEKTLERHIFDTLSGAQMSISEVVQKIANLISVDHRQMIDLQFRIKRIIWRLLSQDQIQFTPERLLRLNES